MSAAERTQLLYRPSPGAAVHSVTRTGLRDVVGGCSHARRYDFTDANINNVTTVEYTFGYKKFPGGNIRIFLHHSSLPFQPAR